MAIPLRETQEGTGPRAAESTPVPPPKKRRIILPLLLLVGLAAGGSWGYKTWTYSRTHVTTDNAAIDGYLTPVMAKVAGYVKSVSVRENDRVRLDSVLVRIDPAEYQVRIAQADADLAAARATAGGAGVNGQAQAAVATATGQESSLEAQIGAARANDAKAREDLARMTELAAKQIVSRQQLDAATAAADASAATLVSLQRQVGAATGTVSNAEAGVRLAAARLKAAQAARDNAELQLTYTNVAAPAAGIVSRKQVEVGQLVQAGQPLMTIVSDTGVWVSANFKETQLDRVHVGQDVDIDVDAYAGVAKGKVESIGAATGSKFALLPPDNATGNFNKVVQRVPVRIKITEGLGKDRELRPGMSVVVHVITP